MGGNGRFWAVWGGMAAGAVVVGGAAYRPLPPVTAHYRADIHTEYVKFPSGRDTITAYLAYPERKDPAAFVVCYGAGPDALSIARIRAKGLGVYAENDARINAGLADVDAAIRTYHKSYRYTVYPGVGHGFLRAREKPEVADSAWKAVVGFCSESLEH